MKTNKKYIILITLFVFYIFFAFYDGVILGVDSLEYIEMSSTREPLYPLFISFFRMFYDTNVYLNHVVFVQCVLLSLVCVPIVLWQKYI